jgi:hypothetical protein
MATCQNLFNNDTIIIAVALRMGEYFGFINYSLQLKIFGKRNVS